MHDLGDDRAWRVLVSALVENAMQEAAILHRAGWWKDDPHELCEGQIKGDKIRNGTQSERLARERDFWGSDAPEALMRLACGAIHLRVSRRRFVAGIKTLSKDRMGKRRMGEKAGGGRLSV